MLAITVLWGLLLAQGGAKERTTTELALRQINWLRSKGGFYSPKISIEPLFESDSANVPLGLFAKEGFAKGETVMVIPRRTLVTTGTKSTDMCDTALNLVKQYKLRDKSEFEPYVTYVFSKDSVTLPSTFSAMGKSLLSKIRGTNLPPKDLTDVSFANHCQGFGQGDPELEEFAYLTVVSRAWSDKLIPVYDMINHQSGRFWNIDSTLVHGHEDITVHAIRDIPAGEQLFLSYMDCIDERGYENEYVLPQMIRDFGFVDQYPQRWTFPADPITQDLVFDIDFVSQEADTTNETESIYSPEMHIHWRTGEPNGAQMEFLHKELERLGKLRNKVLTAAEALTDDYERMVATDYYNSLTLALQVATGNLTTCSHDDRCEMPRPSYEEADTSPVKDPAASDKSEPNGERPPVHHRPSYEGNDPKDWLACDDYHRVEKEFRMVESLKSHYQNVTMYYGEQEDDVCLYLQDYLHTCASSRPHYHEVFVHYPARFLDEVKRVLFIGGGDSMVLHEVLKYPELELVVGLELDQSVARSTFKNVGTQPHFDNEKVQWYFGDAAKSLSTLPSDYYGSFDLVIVDILTEVAQALEVNRELKVLEAAMLLMKPGGIIVKNEDEGYVPGTNKGFTKHSVDLIYHDVPLYCLQTFVVGSNSIDFLMAEPKDHNVETLYLPLTGEFRENFDSWYNFGVTSVPRQCSKDKKEGSGFKAPHVGVLMILEAEDVAVPLDSAEAVKSGIIEAMAKSALTEVESLPYEYHKKGFSFTVIAGEGYVAVRCISELQYCAFDIQLYGAAIGNLESTKAVLLEAVGSKRWSSYRFVTAGMLGLKEEKGKIGPPSPEELCEIGKTQGTTPQTKVRKEKSPGDFGAPTAATLHSYNNTSPLAQWRSQKAEAKQVLVQLEVPLFIGEKVKVKQWLEGTVVKRRGEDVYTISFDAQDETQRRVKEDRIERSNALDKTLVTKFMNDAVDLILESAGCSLEPGTFSRKEVEGVGKGTIIATSWKGGNAVATWDGDDVVALNLFFASTAVDVAEILRNAPHDKIFLLTFDEFPRGTGNVVTFDNNFDIPVWA